MWSLLVTISFVEPSSVSNIIGPRPVSVPFTPVGTFMGLGRFVLFVTSTPAATSMDNFVFPPAVCIYVPL